MGGSRNSPKLVIIVAAGFASVLAALSISAYISSIEHDEAFGSGVPDTATQITDPPTLVHYTSTLGRQLGLISPFDVAVGDMMGGVVPIADVNEAERTKLRTLWECLVAPDFSLRENARIEWRKVRWSRIRWQVREGRHKDPSPPGPLDEYVARWFIDGSPFIVGGSWYPNKAGWGGVTISLTGDDRLHIRYPRPWEIEPQYQGRTIVDEIDKSRLLAILTTVFRFPWQSVDDFVVTWRERALVSLGPSLRIESLRYHQHGEARDWFDEVAFVIEPGDPQKLSFAIHPH